MIEYEVTIPLERAGDLEAIAFPMHRGGCRRWYYFNEPDGILIRGLAMYEMIALSDALSVRLSEREQPNGDTEGWGDAWPTVVEAFIANTALAVKLATPGSQRPPLLHASKYIHCLMNTLGWDRADEIDGYAEWARKHHVVEMLEQIDEDLALDPARYDADGIDGTRAKLRAELNVIRRGKYVF